MNRYRIVFDATFRCQGVYSTTRSSALILADSRDGALRQFGENLTLGASLKVKPAYLDGDISIIRVEEGWKWNSRQRKEKIDDAIKTLRLYLSPEEFNSIFVQGTSEYVVKDK